MSPRSGIKALGFLLLSLASATALADQALDKAALEVLYASAGGNDWTNNTGWVSTSDHCTWYGVSCDTNGRVRVVQLNHNNLNGSLPSEIGNLSELEGLFLNNNSLDGGIPLEITNLTGLTELQLSHNNLTGPIPSSIVYLSALQRLGIGNNQLTGGIPAEVGQLTQLEWIDLSFNSLSGQIPTQLGSLTALTNLDLRYNALVGSIPSSLGNLSQLANLDLSSNELTGTIPAELGSLAAVTRLDLGANQLTGSVPESFGNLSQIEFLQLTDNQLSGPLPPQLGALVTLKTLSLNVNDFSGPIPTEYMQLTQLEELRLGQNNLSGTIPSEFSNLTSLKLLSLVINNLTGVIPDALTTLPNLERLSLHDNQLTGSIPAGFGSQTTLVSLLLWGNNLTGTIPLSLASLNNLEWLALNDNSLTGNVPAVLWDMSNLKKLYLNDNALQGCLPGAMGAMSALEELTLHNNQCVSKIPTDLVSLSNLKKLTINNNGMYGVISENLGTFIGQLEHFNLTQNQFNCPYPSALASHLDTGTCSYLINASVSGTGGTISQLGDILRDEGETLLVTLIPDPHFRANPVSGTCPGTLSGLDYTAGPIFDNCTVVASFSQITHIVSIDGGADGIVSPANDRVVNDGQYLAYELTPYQGYEVGSFGSSSPSNCPLSMSGDTLTVGPVTADCAITVSFAPITHLVSPSVTPSGGGSLQAGGTVTPPDPVTVNEGNSVTFTFAANEGYVLRSIGGDCPGAQSDDSFTAGPITSDCSVEGVFATPEDIDKEALEALYNATNGGGWANNSGWLSSADHCTWFGITCADGRVIEVYLQGNNLQGTIPAKLWELSALREISLNSNQLFGPIPSGVGSLENLEVLMLSKNGLTGAIPSEIGQLSKLRRLYLENNALVGVIPPELGALSSLNYLYLGGNHLTGGIPAELGLLSNLVDLSLQFNRNLGGGASLPAALSNLTQLESLWMEYTQFSGPIPSWLFQMTNLVTLDLENNNFGNDGTGTIPADVGTMTNLVELNLASNNLVGALPDALQQLTSLERLFLWSNQLEGDLPVWLADLPVKSINLQSNQFTGQLPAEWGEKTDLEAIYLFENNLTGSIPTEWASLTQLKYFLLYDNQLSGQIPAFLGNFPALQIVNLADNELTGPIPAELGNGSIKTLQLANNQLSGVIPHQLFSNAELTGVYVRNNNLSGVLPPEISSSSLADLEVHNNQIQGPISEQLGTFISNLSYFNLTGNQFACPYPTALATHLSSDTCDDSASYFLVSPSVNGDGSISPALARHVENLSSVRFETYPDPGYRADVSGNCAGAWDGDVYVVGPVTADCSIAFDFVRDFVVTASSGANGSISPSGAIGVLSNEIRQFQIFPAPGYTVDQITGSCPWGRDGNTLSVGPVVSDCNINVTFTQIFHIVYGVNASGGGISPVGATYVAENGSIQFTVTPDAGYYLTDMVTDCPSWSQNGNIVLVSPVTVGCSVQPVFSQQVYTVQANAGPNGSINPSGTLSKPYGSAITFTITPDEGYEIAGLTNTCGGELAGNTLVTESIIQDCSVSVSFTTEIHQVQICADAGGAVIDSQGAYISDSCQLANVADGSSLSLTSIADDFYYTISPLENENTTCPEISCRLGADEGQIERQYCDVGPVSGDCAVHFDFLQLQPGTRRPNPPSLQRNWSGQNEAYFDLFANYQGSDAVSSYTLTCESPFNNSLSSSAGRSSGALTLGTPTNDVPQLRMSDGSSRAMGRLYSAAPELMRAIEGDVLSFTLPSGLMYLGDVTRTELSQHGNRIIEASREDIHITAVVNQEGNFVSSVRGPEGKFVSHIINGRSVVFSKQDGEFVDNPFHQDYRLDEVSESPDREALPLQVNETSGTTVITVGVLYDSAFESAFDEFALIDFYLDVANQSYQNAGVDLRFDLVGTMNYDPIYGYLPYDLDYITCGRSDCGDPITSTKNAGVQSFRDQVKADLIVQMMRYGSDVGGGTICGVGQLPYTGSAISTYTDRYSYNINAVQSAYYGDVCGDTVVAHEIGHNLGLWHDRATLASQGWPDNYPPELKPYYPFAHGYKVAGVFGTTMSYTSYPEAAIYQISTPDRSYLGYATGTEDDDSAQAVRNVMQYYSDIYNNLVTYEVTPIAGAGGAISPAEPQVVPSGDRATFDLMPDEGYRVESVSSSCGVGSLVAGQQYTTAPVFGDCTVEVSFQQIGWVATGPYPPFSPGPGPGFSDLPAGQEFTCTAVVTNQAGNSDPSSAVTFTTDPYLLDINQSGSGVVRVLDLPRDDLGVEEGGYVTLSLIPSYRWQLGDVGGSCPGAQEGNYYFVGPVTQDCSVDVQFVPQPSYTVTAAAQAGGNISPGGSVTVYEGENQQFTLTPNSGFGIDGVEGDCPGELTDGIFYAGPITQNCSITAQFYSVSTCAMQNYEFTSQAEINAFASSGCTDIQGDLTIGIDSTSAGSEGGAGRAADPEQRDGQQTLLEALNQGPEELSAPRASPPLNELTDIVDLTPLSSIRSVAGNVLVDSNAELSSLLGLENLHEIGGNLSILNSNLLSLDGLSGLRSVGGDLSIRDNSSLIDLDGLSSASFRNGLIELYWNTSLSDISGLAKAESPSKIRLFYNPALSNLNGLSGVTGHVPEIELKYNYDLVDISALSGVTSVYKLDLYYNSSLETLLGLNNLTLASNVFIQFHDMLTDLDDLSGLRSIDSQLYINSNGRLANLQGLSSVTTFGSQIGITNNSQMTSLSGIENLTNVADFLWIEGNGIRDVAGLANFESAESFYLRYNYSLTNCQDIAWMLGYPDGTSSGVTSLYLYSNGYGCSSLDQIFADIQPPQAPLLSKLEPGARQIAVTMQVVESGTYAVDRYHATCRSGGSSFNASSTSSRVVVSGLSNGGTYTCTGQVQTRAGMSPSSGESISVSLPIASAPSGLSINKIEPDDEGLIVSLNLASKGGYDTVTYVVQCTGGGRTIEKRSPYPTVNVTGLQNGISYSCRAWAFNDDGQTSTVTYPSLVAPEEQLSTGLPIWMLYEAIKNQQGANLP